MNAHVPPQNALTVHEINDEPRVLDTDLGKRLGYDEPVAIRRLIDRHCDELSQHGITVTVTENTRKPGRPAKARYLNEPQALLICMFARTVNAQAARAEVIRVFMAYRHGHLIPAYAAPQPALTRNFQDTPMWAVDHPEHGELLMAQHVLLYCTIPPDRVGST